MIVVGWKNGELKSAAPATAAGPGRHQVQRARLPVVVDLQHARAEHGRTPATDVLELAGEPLRLGDVVGVEPRDVPRTSGVDAAVERGSETESLRVRQHDEPRVVDRCEELVRAVLRRVVDDDQLELGQRLPQDARDRLAEGRDGIVGREDDGDERRRGHGTPGSGR